MGEFVPLLGGWFWWVVAGALLMLELAAPGVFFVWLAIPAAAVGGLDMMFNIGWQLELVAFAVLSLISVYAGRKLLGGRHALDSDKPNLNQRMNNLVGRSFVLAEAIVEGRGRLTIDSTIWEIQGPDVPGGQRVKITGIDGMRFIVDKA